jgi:hypothetical protein
LSSGSVSLSLKRKQNRLMEESGRYTSARPKLSHLNSSYLF